MIQFMLIAAPRSGTTWAANWLTTEDTLCLHDPLFQRHYSDLDAFPTSKRFGVACTGLANFPHWVNAHPARKVILHRDFIEINESLAARGMPRIAPEAVQQLDKIEGIHAPWTDLFERPKNIYEFLLQRPFDQERHGLLREINMQPNFENITVNWEVTLRLVSEMRSAAGGRK